MDLLTYQLVDELQERTAPQSHAAICLTCRGGSHDPREACWAACRLCGSTGQLRSAGGAWHCANGACAGAASPVLEVEPVPSRRGRWGFHGDRTLPAYTVGFDASMEGAGHIGRFPTEDHARAYAEAQWSERMRAAGPSARLLAQPAGRQPSLPQPNERTA